MTTSTARSGPALRRARLHQVGAGPAAVGVGTVLGVSALLPHGVPVPPAVAAWLAVWMAVCVQALPFLALGVAASGAVAAFLPSDLVRHLVPRDPVVAVGAAGLFGVVLPGCECASVPVARSLMGRGVPTGAALTFMLAAPAINPVVLVSTAVAFAGHPTMVLARFLAALGTACTVGWLWVRFGNSAWLRTASGDAPPPGPAWSVFRRTVVHDLLHAGGFLVLGAGLAAAVNVLLPVAWLTSLSGHAVVAVLVLAVMAVLVSICSEADAFVAASLTAFSPTAQLVFLTVSPMVDLKLISLQIGTFGPALAARFAPATFGVAILVASTVGAVVLPATVAR